jgi:hypothetical protein
MNRRTTAAYIVSAGLVAASGAGAVVASAGASPSRHAPAVHVKHVVPTRVVTKFEDVTDPAPSTSEVERPERHGPGTSEAPATTEAPVTIPAPVTVPAPPTTAHTDGPDSSSSGHDGTDDSPETGTSEPAETHTTEPAGTGEDGGHHGGGSGSGGSHDSGQPSDG